MENIVYIKSICVIECIEYPEQSSSFHRTPHTKSEQVRKHLTYVCSCSDQVMCGNFSHPLLCMGWQHKCWQRHACTNFHVYFRAVILTNRLVTRSSLICLSGRDRQENNEEGDKGGWDRKIGEMMERGRETKVKERIFLTGNATTPLSYLMQSTLLIGNQWAENWLVKFINSPDWQSMGWKLIGQVY